MVQQLGYGLDGQRFNSSPKRPDQLWDPSSLLLNGQYSSLPGVKRQAHEINHSPPSNAKVTNEWSYTSTPSISLYRVVRDNFTFIHTNS